MSTWTNEHPPIMLSWDLPLASSDHQYAHLKVEIIGRWSAASMETLDKYLALIAQTIRDAADWAAEDKAKRAVPEDAATPPAVDTAPAGGG